MIIRKSKKIADLKWEISELSQRVKMLECSHIETKFVRCDLNAWDERCVKCGKVLKYYLPIEEKLQIELLKSKEKTKSIENQLKGIQDGKVK